MGYLIVGQGFQSNEDIAWLTMEKGLMIAHNLKIQMPYYDDVERGAKNFEVRKNDRDFKPGQIVLLRPWSEQWGYKGDGGLLRRITYCLHDYDKFGIPGCTIFGMDLVGLTY